MVLYIFIPIFIVVFVILTSIFIEKIIKYIDSKIYVPGKRFYIEIEKMGNNPFDESIKSIEKYEVEIIDVVDHKITGRSWVKFRYLTKEHYACHYFGDDDKLNTIFSMTLEDFENKFPNKTIASLVD